MFRRIIPFLGYKTLSKEDMEFYSIPSMETDEVVVVWKGFMYEWLNHGYMFFAHGKAYNKENNAS